MDSKIRKSFDHFCEHFLEIQSMSSDERENLYKVYKYSFLLGVKEGRSEVLEPKKPKTEIIN